MSRRLVEEAMEVRQNGYRVFVQIEEIGQVEADKIDFFRTKELTQIVAGSHTYVVATERLIGFKMFTVHDSGSTPTA